MGFVVKFENNGEKLEQHRKNTSETVVFTTCVWMNDLSIDWRRDTSLLHCLRYQGHSLLFRKHKNFSWRTYGHQIHNLVHLLECLASEPLTSHFLLYFYHFWSLVQTLRAWLDRRISVKFPLAPISRKGSGKTNATIRRMPNVGTSLRHYWSG